MPKDISECRVLHWDARLGQAFRFEYGRGFEAPRLGHVFGAAKSTTSGSRGESQMSSLSTEDSGGTFGNVSG